MLNKIKIWWSDRRKDKASSDYKNKIHINYVVIPVILLNVLIVMMSALVIREENIMIQEISPMHGVVHNMDVLLDKKMGEELIVGLKTNKADLERLVNAIGDESRTVELRKILSSMTEIMNLLEVKTTPIGIRMFLNANTELEEELNHIMKTKSEDIRSHMYIFILFILTGTIVGSTIIIGAFNKLNSYYKELTHLANSDALTHIANRRRFIIDLQDRIKWAELRQRHFAVIFIDLDKFKKINDIKGHEMGDIILKAVASALKVDCREGDVVARIAGDEFAILTETFVNKKSVKNAVIALMKRVTKRITKIYISSTRITYSAGIAIFPNDATTKDSILHKSDLAMYKAKEVKEKERNKWMFYNDYLQVKTDLIEMQIENALNTNSFVLLYQPKIDATINKCIGVEALLRLELEDGSILTPDVFIPVAEHSKQIVNIGKWIIKRVAQDSKKLPCIVFSFNVSPIQLNDKDFEEDVYEVIIENKLENKLELEITESVMVRDWNIIERLAKLPLTIAIDDFGTGYSALSYMHEFKGLINTLKIDKSFIDNIHNEDSFVILKAVTLLAKHFKYNIVVEGVETEEQLNILQKLECNIIQGFLYSKPLHIKDLCKYIKCLQDEVCELEA